MTDSEFLAQRRRALRMTQDHLAGAARVSRSTVQRAERGQVVSDENLRSMLSVLGLRVEDLSMQGATPDGAAVETPARAERDRIDKVEAWEAACTAVPFLLFAVLRGNPGWFEDLSAGTKFWLILGYIGLGAYGSVLAGRILWRRWRHPDADALTFGPRPGGARAWRPGFRWTRRGSPVATWPGAVIASTAILVLTFAGHYPTLGSALIPYRPSTGFDPTQGPSGAWYVEPSSRLEAAGIRPGDQVVAVDGEPLLTRLGFVAAIRDHEGRAMPMTVARPGTRGSYGGSSSPDLLNLTVDVVRDPAGCPADTPCGWIGDIRGLFSPMKAGIALEAQIRMFGREVRTLGAMVTDPGLSAYSELRAGHPRSFRLWLDWLNLRMAAAMAVMLTLGVTGSTILVHQLRTHLVRDLGLPGSARASWQRLRGYAYPRT